MGWRSGEGREEVVILCDGVRVMVRVWVRVWVRLRVRVRVRMGE